MNDKNYDNYLMSLEDNYYKEKEEEKELTIQDEWEENEKILYDMYKKQYPQFLEWAKDFIEVEASEPEENWQSDLNEYIQEGVKNLEEEEKNDL